MVRTAPNLSDVEGDVMRKINELCRALEGMPQSLRMSDVVSKRNLFPVLVVDDDLICRELLAAYLVNAGYQVQQAASADEAENMLLDNQSRLVLCDWLMPIRNGLELCQQLRQQEQQYHYLLLMTAQNSQQAVIEGLQSGADDFLSKGFSQAELIARVDCGVRVLLAQTMLEKQQQELLYQVQHDALTTVYNRAYLLDMLPRLLATSQRYNENLAIVMIDIDRFKTVNDSYGHISGDWVLKATALVLQQGVRKTDMVARYGGEEFMLVLPHTDGEQAWVVAEKVRQQLSQTNVVLPEHGTILQVTASFGVTQLLPEDSVDSLMQRADRLLYQSKYNGRNCCTRG